MSIPFRDVSHIPVSAAATFWLGSQPIFIGYLAYSRFWLGEGVGYEGGLHGFLLGVFVWGVYSILPALAFLIAVLVPVMLFRKTAINHAVRIYVYSGLIGLLCSLILLVLAEAMRS